MVVNRKQPTAPQPVSRSASTQHLPTKRTVPTKGASKLNGSAAIDSRSSKPTSQKLTKTRAKKRRPKSFLDHLFLISLSLFTFYAFYACRPNPIFSTPLHNQAIDPNPLCRSLHGYRVHILEPYVLPSVKHTLAFTHNLAEPYITATQRKVDPYVAPIVKATNSIKPHVSRVVNTSKVIWNDTLVPFYKGTLLRYYRIAILPRYRLYIKPRLLPLAARASKAYEYYVSRPLHIQATRVNKALHSKLHPYVARVQPYVNQAYATVYDITAQTITTYKAHVHPRLIAAWTVARPHLYTVLKVTKSASLKTAEIAATRAKYATREANSYRRTYVDPHVRKIWDKVAEGTLSASIPDTVPTTITTPPLAADLPDTTTAESVIEPTSVTAAEDLESTSVSITPEVDIEDPQVAHASIPSPEEPVEQEVPTESETPLPPAVDAYDAPVVAAAEPEEELVPAPSRETLAEPTPAESVTASKAPTPSATASVAPTPAASEIPEAAKSVEAASLTGSTGRETPELDLDEFLASLGVDEQPEISSAPEDASAPPAPAPTPELSAQEAARLEEERLAAIAVKRGKLVDRHEKWFADLAELIANETDTVVDALAELRETKVAELAKMAAGSGAGTGLIDEVQAAGERLLKGLDGYVRKAETRSAAWKFPLGNPADVPKTERETKNALAKAEKEKWGTVVEKVEAKFTDTVQTLRATVHAWFTEERASELEVVASSALRVKGLAQTAQADIGLQYAWLEDVTYADWQSYHELMNMFQVYEELAHALQNGTELPEPAPLPPVDTIVPALDTLHNELQDVILGFNVALGPIRSAASRVFSVRSTPEDVDEEESGFFVVRDGEVRKDDMRGLDVDALRIEKKEGAGTVGLEEAGTEDEVRILPIGPGPGGEGEALDPGMIFVGKDRVQVEQALGGVPLEPAAARHEEL